jgi:hypothetical protein
MSETKDGGGGDHARAREALRQREAEIALGRAERESETVLRAGFAGASRSGAGDDANDPVVRLGRKIGRTAGAVFAVGLVIYLIATYL